MHEAHAWILSDSAPTSPDIMTRMRTPSARQARHSRSSGPQRSQSDQAAPLFETRPSLEFPPLSNGSPAPSPLPSPPCPCHVNNQVRLFRDSSQISLCASSNEPTLFIRVKRGPLNSCSGKRPMRCHLSKLLDTAKRLQDSRTFGSS